MLHRKNVKDILMASMLMREIERARQELLGGPANPLVRAALVTAFIVIRCVEPLTDLHHPDQRRRRHLRPLVRYQGDRYPDPLRSAKYNGFHRRRTGVRVNPDLHERSHSISVSTLSIPSLHLDHLDHIRAAGYAHRHPGGEHHDFPFLNHTLVEQKLGR